MNEDPTVDLGSSIALLVERMRTCPEDFDPDTDSKFGWLIRELSHTQYPDPDAPKGHLLKADLRAFLSEREIATLVQGYKDVRREQFRACVMALVAAPETTLKAAMKNPAYKGLLMRRLAEWVGMPADNVTQVGGLTQGAIEQQLRQLEVLRKQNAILPRAAWEEMEKLRQRDMFNRQVLAAPQITTTNTTAPEDYFK